MEPCSFAISAYHRLPDEGILDRICRFLLNEGFTLDEEDPDLVLVLGGDGSLLHAMHDHDMKGSYVLVNNGHLGFFADYELDAVDDLLEDIVTKEPTLERLPLLSYFADGTERPAVCDIAIQSAKTVDITLYLDDRKLTETRASGLVLGTPVASTGYLASLASPLLFARNVYQYAFVAPVRNRLFVNAIDRAVLSKDDILEVEVALGKADVYIDGILAERDIEKSFRVRMSDRVTVALAHFAEVDNRRRVEKALYGTKED